MLFKRVLVLRLRASQISVYREKRTILSNRMTKTYVYFGFLGRTSQSQLLDFTLLQDLPNKVLITGARKIISHKSAVHICCNYRELEFVAPPFSSLLRSELWGNDYRVSGNSIAIISSQTRAPEKNPPSLFLAPSRKAKSTEPHIPPISAPSLPFNPS